MVPTDLNKCNRWHLSTRDSYVHDRWYTEQQKRQTDRESDTKREMKTGNTFIKSKKTLQHANFKPHMPRLSTYIVQLEVQNWLKFIKRTDSKHNAW